MILIGHRGARKEAPENTQAGFRHLRQLGIHHVELDVRLSADDQLVVLHDSTVNRTSNHKGDVLGFSAVELSEMNATVAFPHWPNPCGIPTLESVLQEWPELQSIQLEVKTAAKPVLEKIALGLAELIARYDLMQIATVTSADQSLLAIMHRLAPDTARGFVAERFTRDPLDVCLSHHCHMLVLNYHRCTSEMISAAHERGLTVSTWTVNDVNIARRLQRAGIDSLITDVPSLMLKHLHVTNN